VTRVFAPIHAGNARSIRVAEKLGMRLESVQPRSAFKRGEVIDQVLYASYQ
jgi:RimJ/RimL family protein N-acetyltransferase